MKTPEEIEAKILRVTEQNKHILTGSLATVQINAPRACMQISAESYLLALHWTLGKQFKSALKGVNT